jgi:L-ascorbate metabolism protein UlaG (beta-lactamase superfamily)
MNYFIKICLLLIPLFSIIVIAEEKSEDDIRFIPISHATFVIQSGDITIYVDPVGEVSSYKPFPVPDMILITDIHGDHLNSNVVNALRQQKTVVVGPEAVIKKLQAGEILKNGEEKKFGDILVEAIPMYNLTEGRIKYHEKGRGNGYVITVPKKRIYISGDTEDIPEMRQLKDIDYAIVCMNLPYTMTVEQAASAVLEFKPKVVIPYHYRGTGGFSDVDKFKELVSKNKNIEVRLLDWYPD